nr:hypothetical protein [Planosporangium flavigriseum]
MSGTWLCVGCSLPWPCPSRRRQLLAQYTDAPVSLALVLGSAMIEAAADLRSVPAGDLHEQFVGWLPHDHPDFVGP